MLGPLDFGLLETGDDHPNDEDQIKTTSIIDNQLVALIIQVWRGARERPVPGRHGEHSRSRSKFCQDELVFSEQLDHQTLFLTNY